MKRLSFAQAQRNHDSMESPEYWEPDEPETEYADCAVCGHELEVGEFCETKDCPGDLNTQSELERDLENYKQDYSLNKENTAALKAAGEL